MKLEDRVRRVYAELREHSSLYQLEDGMISFTDPRRVGVPMAGRLTAILRKNGIWTFHPSPEDAIYRSSRYMAQLSDSKVQKQGVVVLHNKFLEITGDTKPIKPAERAIQEMKKAFGRDIHVDVEQVSYNEVAVSTKVNAIKITKVFIRNNKVVDGPYEVELKKLVKGEKEFSEAISSFKKIWNKRGSLQKDIYAIEARGTTNSLKTVKEIVR